MNGYLWFVLFLIFLSLLSLISCLIIFYYDKKNNYMLNFTIKENYNNLDSKPTLDSNKSYE